MDAKAIHEHMNFKINMAHELFCSAVEELKEIDRELRDIEIRHERAKNRKNEPRRVQLYMRKVTTEGLRHMFYEYAQLKAKQIEALRKRGAVISVH